MPALPAAVGLAKVTFNFESADQGFGDSLYFQRDTLAAFPPGYILTLAVVAALSWVANMIPLQDPTTTLVSVTATDLSSDMGAVSIATSGTPGSFAGTHQVPLNAVARQTYGTARRYRGGRPGFNVSGIDELKLADQRSWTTAFQALLNTTLALTISTIATNYHTDAGDTITHSAVSYYDKALFPIAPHLRTTPLVLPVTSREVQQRVCTLRKRLGKGISG